MLKIKYIHLLTTCTALMAFAPALFAQDNQELTSKQQINAMFDDLRKEVNAINDHVKAIDKSLGRTEAYLDLIASDPASVLNADLQTIVGTAKGLDYGQWNSELEANKGEILNAAAENAQVQKIIAQLEAEKRTFEAELNNLSAQGDRITSAAQNLATQFSTFFEKAGTFEKVSLGLMAVKIPDLAKDAEKVFQNLNTITERIGSVSQKFVAITTALPELNLVNALQTEAIFAEAPTTSNPSYNAIPPAPGSAPSTASNFNPSLPAYKPQNVSEAPAPQLQSMQGAPNSFSGFWVGQFGNLGPIQMLLGEAQPGYASGFARLPASGRQFSLIGAEVTPDRVVLTDGTPGMRLTLVRMGNNVAFELTSGGQSVAQGFLQKNL